MLTGHRLAIGWGEDATYAAAILQCRQAERSATPSY